MRAAAALTLLLIASVPVVRAADTAFFENKVRPLLASKCFNCHSEKEKKSKGGLTLDTLAGVQAGGDSGLAVVPKKPDESKLIEAVRPERDPSRAPLVQVNLLVLDTGTGSSSIACSSRSASGARSRPRPIAVRPSAGS